MPAGKAYLIPCPAFKVPGSMHLTDPTIHALRAVACTCGTVQHRYASEMTICATFACGAVHECCCWCCSWTGGQCCAPLVMAAHRSAAARRHSTAAWHAAARSRRHCTAGDQAFSICKALQFRQHCSAMLTCTTHARSARLLGTHPLAHGWQYRPDRQHKLKVGLSTDMGPSLLARTKLRRGWAHSAALAVAPATGPELQLKSRCRCKRPRCCARALPAAVAECWGWLDALTNAGGDKLQQCCALVSHSCE